MCSAGNRQFGKARATRCNFFPQVSADDSAEEADHVEINGAASMCSTVIFSLHVFAENGQLVHMVGVKQTGSDRAASTVHLEEWNSA